MYLKKYKSFENLEESWQKVWSNLPEKSPFSSFYWTCTWHKIFPEGKPYIYELTDKENKSLGSSSFKKIEDIMYWSAGEEVTDYQDLICEDKYKEEFWKLISKEWQKENIKQIILRNIPEDSTTRKILKSCHCEPTDKSEAISFYEEKEDVVPFIELPKTFEEYLSQLSRKDRHEMRRKIRRFKEETGNDWQLLKSISKTHDKDCHNFFVLFKQNGEGKRQFLTPPMEDFFCQITSQMQKLGLLDFSSLIVNDETIAQTISFVNNKIIYLYNIAVNPKYYHLSPGIIINKLLIEESIQKGRLIYDFMQGNERYKYQLGGKDGKVYKISIKLI